MATAQVTEQQAETTFDIRFAFIWELLEGEKSVEPVLAA